MKKLLFVLALAVFSCSPSRPRILQTFSQLNYTWDKSWDEAAESLTVFVHPENADGLEQIESLHIVHDGGEVYWTLGPETWTRMDRPGETWIGGNLLRIPGQSLLPRGNYRVLLTTRSGEKERTTFTIDSEPISSFAGTWPQLSVVRGEVFVSQAPPSYALWVYGTEGRLLTQIVMDLPKFPLEVIQSNPGVSGAATRVWIYWMDEKLGVGIQTGPFPLIDLEAP